MCEAGAGVKREWQIGEFRRFLAYCAKLLVGGSENMLKLQNQGLAILCEYWFSV